MDWNLDPTHSSIEFAVRHLGFATVRGRFEKFTVDFRSDEDGTPTSVTADIDVASVATGAPDRDGHLRSADFFDAEYYPKIHFASTSIQRLGEGNYRIDGELTIRGQVHPVSFDADLGESIVDPWGNQRLAAEASGKLNRTLWGLSWNRIIEAGSLLVGEEVRFTINAQVVAA